MADAEDKTTAELLPCPIDQTAFETEATHGNCMQAAVASILGFPLDQVPNFIEEKTPWPTLHKFLNSIGFRLFQTGPAYAPAAFCLATGMSPRGISHMVVCYGEEVVHDPHPSRGGIEVERKFFLLKDRPWNSLNGSEHSQEEAALARQRSEADLKEAYEEGRNSERQGSWETSKLRARLFPDSAAKPE